LWREWGISPLELLEWPTALIEGFQACDIVEAERSPARAWADSLGPAPWPAGRSQDGQARTGGTGRNLPVVE